MHKDLDKLRRQIREINPLDSREALRQIKDCLLQFVIIADEAIEGLPPEPDNHG